MDHTTGFFFCCYLQSGSKGSIPCLCESPDLEHICRTRLQVVHCSRGGFGPHCGIDPVLLVLYKTNMIYVSTAPVTVLKVHKGFWQVAGNLCFLQEKIIWDDGCHYLLSVNIWDDNTQNSHNHFQMGLSVGTVNYIARFSAMHISTALIPSDAPLYPLDYSKSFFKSN